MGDDRKAEYEMAPTSDPENPEPPTEKAELQTEDDDDQQWSGLGKEELLRVADTPAWNWTRNILLILFWIAWVLMLVIAIILVVKAPSCPHVEWYQKSSIYQVNVRSFQDSDGDGIGDINGLKGRVKQIKEDFGAESIVLSPIFKQANDTKWSKTYGYNTVDYMDIDPNLGTLEEFKTLIEEIQVNGMHIILEFVPNHSSHEHDWFVKSSKSKDNKYRNYYIWAPGTAGGPPNDWLNYNNEPAWTLLGEEYYYHYYESSQPDLNYGSGGNATAAIQEAMDFWLAEQKVDGFVIVDADRLVEGPITTSRRRRQAEGNLPTGATGATEMMTTTLPMDISEAPGEPSPDGGVDGGGDGGDMDGGDMDGGDMDGGDVGGGSAAVQYTISGGVLAPEAKQTLDALYEVLDKNSYLGKYRVFIPQHSGDLAQNILYQDEMWRGFPICLSFADMIGDDMTSYNIKDQLIKLVKAKKDAGKEDLWDSWMIGHAGISRVASRAESNKRLLTMLLYTLPGTPIPFYGDELGLTDLPAGAESPQLAPYPWDNTKFGGFLKVMGNGSAPWQDVVSDLDSVNAETQDDTDGSFLKFVQNLAEYHGKPSILAGSFNLTTMTTEFLAYKRSFPEWPEYMVALNLKDERMEGVSLLEGGAMGTVVLSASGDMIDDEVALDDVTVAGNDALLIELAKCDSCLF